MELYKELTEKEQYSNECVTSYTIDAPIDKVIQVPIYKRENMYLMLTTFTSTKDKPPYYLLEEVIDEPERIVIYIGSFINREGLKFPFFNLRYLIRKVEVPCYIEIVSSYEPILRRLARNYKLIEKEDTGHSKVFYIERI